VHSTTGPAILVPTTPAPGLPLTVILHQQASQTRTGDRSRRAKKVQAGDSTRGWNWNWNWRQSLNWIPHPSWSPLTRGPTPQSDGEVPANSPRAVHSRARGTRAVSPRARKTNCYLVPARMIVVPEVYSACDRLPATARVLRRRILRARGLCWEASGRGRTSEARRFGYSPSDLRVGSDVGREGSKGC